MKFILASNSPRRKEILSKAGYDFVVKPSNYDEKINGLNYSSKLVENCAMQKALDVKKQTNTKNIIISADTVVVLENIILGKPKNELEAFEMLKKLSGKTHFVATSICLIKEEKIITASEKTFVTFKKLNKDEILNYIQKRRPLDKAGSYGIQDENFNFACEIKGELNNVIGFPLNLFQKTLKQF